MADLAIDLPGAVERGEILAHFQPQFDVGSWRIVGVETLSRWQHPAVGMVSPNDFIPIAEEIGVIDELGDHMIELGCAAAADWQRQGLQMDVAVNVSALQLSDPGFAKRVVDTIRRHGLDPHRLIVEVTESAEVIDVSSVAQRLDWLRSVGVTISVDDFGTGHSSVEQMLDLRATELKIDQSLVRDDGEAATALLTAVVSFAHEKGLRVVAEGIETEEQRDRVQQLRCDRAQGFLLGRPVDKSAIDALLAAEN